MAIDFPSSPTVGQTFTSGNVTYTWDGTKWTASEASSCLKDGDTIPAALGSASAPGLSFTGSDSDVGLFVPNALGLSTGNLAFATNGTQRFAITTLGAFGLGGSSNTGNSGQVLTSQGGGSSPIWATPSGLNFATAVTANNTTGAYDFTGIPSTAKRITVMTYGLIGGSSTQLIQLGSSGGILSSTYNAGYTLLTSSVGGTNGFNWFFNSTYTAGSYACVELINIDSNKWVAQGTYFINNTGGSSPRPGVIAGGVDLGATLTTIRVTNNAASNFTSGTINIAYE